MSFHVGFERMINSSNQMKYYDRDKRNVSLEMQIQKLKLNYHAFNFQSMTNLKYVGKMPKL